MPKVLVVDDTPDVRETLCGILKDKGHDAKVAANESEAFAQVSNNAFDFAVIDVRLHGEGADDESGISLAMALRTLAPKVRIILLTRFIRAEQIVRMIRYHGVVDYVDKSLSTWTDDILKAIDKATTEAQEDKLIAYKSVTRFFLSLENKEPLVLSTAGEYVSFDRSQASLNIDIDEYSRKADNASTSEENSRFQARVIGKDLWRDIFDGHLAIGNSYAAASSCSDLVPIVFAGRVEFLRLPLEFLIRNSRHLVLQQPIMRFVSGGVPRRLPLSPEEFVLTGKVSVLLIASNTDFGGDNSIPGVDEEINGLRSFLKKQSFVEVEVTTIPTEEATYDRVKEEITDSAYDIIHYAGHGHFEVKSPEQSKLYFWGKKNKVGSPIPMLAMELKFLLEKSNARMLYLSSCFGTATAAETALLDDDFLGIADAAVKAGIPTVIGYRWPVSDSGAKTLALKFYASLLYQGSPEVALLEARKEAASSNPDDPTWLSPIMIHQVQS